MRAVSFVAFTALISLSGVSANARTVGCSISSIESGKVVKLEIDFDSLVPDRAGLRLYQLADSNSGARYTVQMTDGKKSVVVARSNSSQVLELAAIGKRAVSLYDQPERLLIECRLR